MKTQTLTRVRQLFSTDYVSPEVNRAHQRKWVRSVRLLGDRWLLAKNQPRPQPQTQGEANA
jgi:hypothetical protein